MEYTHPCGSRERLQTSEKNSLHCQGIVKIQYQHSSNQWKWTSRRRVADRIRQCLGFLLERQGPTWRQNTQSWIRHQVRLLKQIPCLPTSVDERLMKLHLPVSGKRFITIISVYAPTMTCTEEIRKQCYADLDTELRDMPSTVKLLILGDFNARFGMDKEQWGGLIGKHGVGRMNSNGLLLLSKCTKHNLLITISVSSTTLPPANKTAMSSSPPWQCLRRVLDRPQTH